MLRAKIAAREKITRVSRLKSVYIEILFITTHSRVLSEPDQKERSTWCATHKQRCAALSLTHNITKPL